ncbi:hypothetical protein AYO21_02572 [Fonsecaea monophora]|uniref:Uncharacterized protein n=1 Tax=Fonsecaea monophora TaxID=254056 RepID=A0A177FHV5_9EURO|nr:hypothetical protein AYO21_02572 [Fonsecaea monophora]KAH0847185.1 hypothetical protein FOPE_00438 [Fonsecaea pedrosoi]OAG43286.1 hypothetical protein AYO21_02572 [Fonsecaea monophora]
MSTVLGSPQRSSSQTTARTNTVPKPFEVFLAIGNILIWLLAAYVIYLHIRARWDLEACYRAHIQAERQARGEAEKQLRHPVRADSRGHKRKLRQIQEEAEEDQDWRDEMLDWHGELEDLSLRGMEVDTDTEIEARMEIMEIPNRQEFERDNGKLWR